MLRLVPIFVLLTACSISEHHRVAVEGNGYQHLGVWKLDSVLVGDAPMNLGTESLVYFSDEGKYGGFASDYLGSYELIGLGNWELVHDTLWIHDDHSANYFTICRPGMDELVLTTVRVDIPGAEPKDSYFSRITGAEASLMNEMDYHASDHSLLDN